MAELSLMNHRRQRRPPVAESGGLRVIRLVELRRLHLLLAAVIVMETADLALNLWRLRHG